MGSFSILNMFVVGGMLILVTYLGHQLSGRTSSSAAFFTGDGNMPWWAVSASFYATFVSAITFISVPAFVFRDGGNLEMMQYFIGGMLAKIIIAIVFVRSYYDFRSAATVYDYLGQRLSPIISKAALALALTLSSVINAVTVLSAALVINVLTDTSIPLSCFIVVLFSVIWSWIGGLKTVVWTDFLLFVVLVVGVLFSAFATFSSADVSLYEAYMMLDEAAKLKMFDFSLNPEKTYTLWTAITGAMLLSVAAVTQQGTMQRVRACRSVADARKAFFFSLVFYVVPVCLFVVGLGLSLFYGINGIPADLALRLETQPDQVFPFFIVNEIPDGLSGVFIAAVFAAVISTVDTRLTEMSDVSVSNVYRRYLVKDASEAHYLLAARFMIVGWGLLYCGLAVLFSQMHGSNMLEATLTAGSILYGPILGVFLLARFQIGGTVSALAGIFTSLVVVSVMYNNGVAYLWWSAVSVPIIVVLGLLESRNHIDWIGDRGVAQRNVKVS